MSKIDQYIAFIQEAERLKSVLRTAWTAQGRRESTAEHSWRLALLVAVMAEEYPKLDRGKAVLMSLIHDIGELYGGDISAALMPDHGEKYDEESRAAKKIFSMLPEEQGERLCALWEEYNENATPEAKLVKALDKAETIIQHNQGDNPDSFDYGFNLDYGSGLFREDPFLSELRKSLDAGTKSRLESGKRA